MTLILQVSRHDRVYSELVIVYVNNGGAEENTAQQRACRSVL